MLVLGRKEAEAVVIGDDVRIVILKSKDGRVKLGIDAPKEIPVDREEVRQSKEAC